MDLKHCLHFPGAIQNVDLYHARQHLWALARKLYLNREAEQRRWMMIHQDILDKEDIENLVPAIRSLDSSDPELAQAIRTTANYFETHPTYALRRIPPAAPVYGLRRHRSRLQNGHRFPLQAVGRVLDGRAANAILALRCRHINGRFEDNGEARRI